VIAWKPKLGEWISVAFALLAPIRAAPGCRVLMYHAIGGAVAGDRYGLYSLSPSRFAGHVRYLAAMPDTVDLTAGVTAGRGLAITFDDGYRDNLTVAAPLLIEAKLPFTVFVTPDFVASDQTRYLSRSELQELARLPGVTIGAHGYSHRRLTECEDQELARELGESRRWLEDLLGRPVTTMSYPHGAVDSRVRAAAAKAGFTIAACSRFGTHRPGDDPLHVARTDIWAGDDTERLMAKTAGHWDWMRWGA
jgi:peptidoglycan/xylan/chitin deacetylase (PgdA/CDA1 family)